MCLEELESRSREGLDPDAILELAFRLVNARPPDAEAAFSWLIDAAELGSAEAMYNLSLCYLRGSGAPRSLALSRLWSKRCEASIGQASLRRVSGEGVPLRVCRSCPARAPPGA